MNKQRNGNGERESWGDEDSCVFRMWGVGVREQSSAKEMSSQRREGKGGGSK
jgi:hypothetical protein